MVAFGRVVEHDVENDLDSGPVQRLDHIAKFVHRAKRILPRAVGLVRREERNRRIAPVIDFSRRAILGIELEDRQQFDGGDAELLQIRNLLDQTGIGAASLLGNAGTGMAGEAPHVHLVDDGPRGGPFQRRVAFPIVGAMGPPPRSSSPSRRCRLPRLAAIAAVVSSAQRRRGHTDRAELWLDQTAFPLRDQTGLERDSRRSARACVRHEHMPVMVGAVGNRVEADHARRLGVLRPDQRRATPRLSRDAKKD